MTSTILFSYGVVVAQLTIPVSDEEKVREALQNSLQWEYGTTTDSFNYICLIEPRSALMSVNPDLARVLLGRKDTFQLGGPLAAKFFSGETYFSSCIEIDFQTDEVSSSSLSMAERILDAFVSVSLFVRKGHAIFRFQNSEAATQAFKPFCEAFVGIALVRIVPASEHVALVCAWKGKSSLSATAKRLHSVGQSIVGIAQSCLRYC